MKKNWQEIKSVLESYEKDKDIFLSVVDKKGTIVCANATMVKTLHLKDVRTHKVSFLDLLHPVHIEDFKNALMETAFESKPHTMELYLKNGYYHPMKWQVTKLPDGADPAYLCVGHKILDDKRLQ